MTASAAQCNQLFDSMLDALLRDETHEFGVASGREHYAHEVLKLMRESLRLGQPSRRMMKLLADHVEKIKPEQALAILGTKKPRLGFREQDACDTYENLLLDAHIKYERPAHDTYKRLMLDARGPDDEQTARDTRDALLLKVCINDDDERAARIGAYDAYYCEQGRTYATDLLDTSNSADGNFANRAEAAMPTVEELLRRGRVLKRNPRGRPPGKK